MIVARMRDEAPGPARLPHGGRAHLGAGHLGPGNRAHAGRQRPRTGPGQRRMAKAQAPGAWIRVFLHGRWTAAQLLWRSDNGQFFMLTSQEAGRSHSLTRRAIEALPRAPDRTHGSPYRSERAVDNLVSGPHPLL